MCCIILYMYIIITGINTTIFIVFIIYYNIYYFILHIIVFYIKTASTGYMGTVNCSFLYNLRYRVGKKKKSLSIILIIIISLVF